MAYNPYPKRFPVKEMTGVIDPMAMTSEEAESIRMVKKALSQTNTNPDRIMDGRKRRKKKGVK